MRLEPWPEPVTTTWTRHPSTMKLRITSCRNPLVRHSALPSEIHLEWVGRAGHPSSYGLIGGVRISPCGVWTVWHKNGLFRESLAASMDEVWWGLPDEFRPCVEDALAAQPISVRVDKAAHGLVGSSCLVFSALTTLLCRLLAAGIPAAEPELWALFDRSWNEAQQRSP